MTINTTLTEMMPPVSALEPAADAAGRAGDWVSLKLVHKLFVVCHIDQGAVNTILLTINQATDVAGTGSKVLANAVPIWANLDTAASDAYVRQTDAVNYTTDAGVKIKIVVFQIDASCLDVNNDFDCVQVTTGASDAANITSALYVPVMRYMEDPNQSIIVD